MPSQADREEPPPGRPLPERALSAASGIHDPGSRTRGVETAERRARAWRLALTGFATALALGFAWIVPLGEAPDELAHIRYAETLARGRLPAVTSAPGDGYEAHQPPIGYLLPAAVIALRGGLDLSPAVDPFFDFHRSGSRRFLRPFVGIRDALTLRLARSAQVAWIALAVWTALSLAADPRGAAPFLLAPQLLFAGGTLGNDAPVVALTTAAHAALLRYARNGTGAAACACLVTLALFTKASATLLLAPVAVVLWNRRREPGFRGGASGDRTVLASAVASGLLLWIAFHLARTGAPVPRIPRSSRLATAFELLFDPTWLGGLFRSFWAKFGWLNTPLPAVFYVWFALLSAVALPALLRGRGTTDRLFQAAVGGNLLLLVAFQFLVERQAQGRYLLPSIAAIAAAGSTSLPERLRPMTAIVAALVAVVSLEFVRRAYL